MAILRVSELYEKLRPDLRNLERERKRVALLLRMNMFVVVALAIPIAWYIIRSIEEPNEINQILSFTFAIIAMIGILAGETFKYNLTKQFGTRFKRLVIRRIISYMDADLHYAMHNCIPAEVFQQSGLFETPPDRFNGDDLVTGTILGTKIRFSELHTKINLGSATNKRYVTQFKGLFFELAFNKRSNGSLIILPDAVETAVGKVAGQWLQSLGTTQGKLIKLEDPEFERLFVVYGTDQIEARYLLSPSLMRRIIKFRHKAGREVRLSFVDGHVYLAVSYARDLFEPTLFTPLENKAQIKQYLDDLRFALGVVKDLNLNLKLWSH